MRSFYDREVNAPDFRLQGKCINPAGETDFEIYYRGSFIELFIITILLFCYDKCTVE